jgi:hypothetical protein
MRWTSGRAPSLKEIEGMNRIALILALLTVSAPSFAESQTIFKGIPSQKISEGGNERFAESLPREKAVNLNCVISEIDGRFYWASRENVELATIRSGAYLTFQAINGSGYIRVLDLGMKEKAELAGGPEGTFDYVEHLLIGMRSVTYYGIRAYGKEWNR